MKNWYTKTSKKHKYYKQFCNNKKSKLIKSKKTNSVDVIKLHNKMPYIWRFLKPKTRKHMIEIAKTPNTQNIIPKTLNPHKI